MHGDHPAHPGPSERPARPACHAHRLAGIGDEAAPGIEGQIAAIRRLGWRTLELRTVDGIWSADLDPDAFRAVSRRLAEARLDVVCLASRIGNWASPVTRPLEDDLAELETLADQCAALGCRYVRIMSYPNDGLTEPDWGRRVIDRVSRLADRAEQRGVTLLHENCAGWAGDSAERTLRLLECVGSPALRLLFDTGNGVPHGYDAYDLLTPLLPYVAHVHVKDAVRTPGGGTVYTLPGEGEARVPACLRLLWRSGYRGVLSIEPHLATLPHEGLRAEGDDAAALFVRAGGRLGRLLADPALAGPPPAGPPPAGLTPGGPGPGGIGPAGGAAAQGGPA